MTGSEGLKDTFLILSLKLSRPYEDSVWWRANSCGYTTDINEAGGYSREQIEKNSSYYNNGETTKAIPYLKILGHKDTKLTLEFNVAKNLND